MNKKAFITGYMTKVAEEETPVKDRGALLPALKDLAVGVKQQAIDYGEAAKKVPDELKAALMGESNSIVRPAVLDIRDVLENQTYRPPAGPARVERTPSKAIASMTPYDIVAKLGKDKDVNVMPDAKYLQNAVYHAAPELADTLGIPGVRSGAIYGRPNEGRVLTEAERKKLLRDIATQSSAINKVLADPTSRRDFLNQQSITTNLNK